MLILTMMPVFCLLNLKDNQQNFLKGLKKFKKSCSRKHGKSFAELSKEEKDALLIPMDEEVASLYEGMDLIEFH